MQRSRPINSCQTATEHSRFSAGDGAKVRWWPQGWVCVKARDLRQRQLRFSAGQPRFPCKHSQPHCRAAHHPCKVPLSASTSTHRIAWHLKRCLPSEWTNRQESIGDAILYSSVIRFTSKTIKHVYTVLRSTSGSLPKQVH